MKLNATYAGVPLSLHHQFEMTILVPHLLYQIFGKYGGLLNKGITTLAVVLQILTTPISRAQDLDPAQVEAKKLLERLSSTKVPANHSLIETIAQRLRAGDDIGAAEVATTHPNFLNTTVKLMALKMSTREETIRLSLNDFAAAFIGVTRDQRDARELLTGNFYYRADSARLPANVTVPVRMREDLLESNAHFQALENPAVNIGDVLTRIEGQQVVDGANNVQTNPDPAGVLTLRAFMGAHIVDGTNRRPVEFTFREFLCVPIEDWSDTGASDARIGKDIDRFPGGDHMKFLTNCKGCHTGMDGFRGAFARWDFQGNRIVNSAAGQSPGGFTNGISNKMNRNESVFPGGYRTTDNSFVNNARGPANASLFGWRGPASGGMGVREFGVLVANSTRFSQCMVKRVYDAVCRTDLNIKMNMPYIRSYAQRFESGGYNIKELFKSVSVSRECRTM